MWDVVVGIFAIVLGLVLVFAGLRFFFATLPLLGFIVGFLVGASGVHALFGDGILTTLTSWIIGFILGILFAAISYLWWYAGALISAGASGAVLGTAIVRAFGGSASWLLYLMALLGFIAFFILAFVLALPVYVVLINTALIGSTVVIGGVLLVINKIDRAHLGYGTVVAIVNYSWWWGLAAIVLAIVGIFSQLNTISTISLPEEKWVVAPTV